MLIVFSKIRILWHYSLPIFCSFVQIAFYSVWRSMFDALARFQTTLDDSNRLPATPTKFEGIHLNLDKKHDPRKIPFPYLGLRHKAVHHLFVKIGIVVNSTYRQFVIIVHGYKKLRKFRKYHLSKHSASKGKDRKRVLCIARITLANYKW